ncbi:hypothetical protein DY000_02012816 [Brassica cretica]|uniref:1-phosphatidylinositol-4-phosphate 5-kinase n=1 Tax=Brassica cretica TaxID=69181 RepID=A0ABQ7D8M3_BRACR|nr:hypothetical protein DY000_02012816 [Brassica cretica]
MIFVFSLRLEEREFSNGDVYSGQLRGTLPHGKGKYAWSDGIIYEGDWEEGKISGKGKITWLSGAKYEGDFSGGYLHGFGTMTSPDGSVYSGSWRMNVRHGLGRKEYCNSDSYDGSWREGLQDGSGSYTWTNGNRFIGNWKKGKMSGRGVMSWGNGDLFNGFWLNGLRHGSGVYKYADGGFYFGTWSRGLKDGTGVYYPVGSKHPSLKKWHRHFGYNDTGNFILSHDSSINLEELRNSKAVSRTLSEITTTSGLARNSGRMPERFLDENWSTTDPPRDYMGHGPLSKSGRSAGSGENEGRGKNPIVFEREYMQGVLIKERIMSSIDMSRKARPLDGPKEVSISACVSFLGGKWNYYLMLNLQLGIRYTVGKITPVPRREVRASDFGERARITMFFPRNGSQYTPSHKSIDFDWKDYCPMVFRNLREMFKLDAADYMMSICGDDGLREISSPGKSGSIFYLSHDDRFVIKTLKRSEQILLDCSFLESLQIIDYSLLLGLHFRAPDQLNDILEPPNEMSDQESDSVASVEVGLPREPSIPPKGLLLVTHEPNSVNTAPGPHIRGSTLRAFAAGEKEVDLILPGTARLRVQLGVNMPAQAHHKLHQDQEESGTVELFEVYDVVVYMGMIDILQEYNMKKRMEHTCKSIQYDPMSISAIEPTLYAKRFTDFLLKVFPETA